MYPISSPSSAVLAVPGGGQGISVWYIKQNSSHCQIAIAQDKLHSRCCAACPEQLRPGSVSAAAAAVNAKYARWHQRCT